MKCITQTSVTGEQLLYYSFKEVQLLQTQQHGKNVHKSPTYTERKFNIRTYHNKQSFSKIALRCDCNYKMNRAHVR